MSNRRRVRPGGAPEPLRDEVVTFDHPVTGDRIVAVLPVIPEAAPPYIKEGFVRRRLSVLTGACPCGASFPPPDIGAPGTVNTMNFGHENGCPAITEDLVRAVRRWRR